MNDTLPSIALTLFNPLVDNMLVVEENQIVLDSERVRVTFIFYPLGVPPRALSDIS